MKKGILATIVALLVAATPVSAHPLIQVFVDAQAVSFDQAPVIIDDRTLVPMRAIFEALGSEVTWVEESQTVISTKGEDILVLTIGETGLYKNGQLVYTMDVPARILGDRTMVPVRAIAESFDAEVQWDPVSYQIRIVAEEESTQNGYSTTVTAEDGTTVLSFTMNIPRSDSEKADEIEKALVGEAKEVAQNFIKQYGEKAKKDYALKKEQGTMFSPYTFVGSYEMTRDDSKWVSFLGTSTQNAGESEPVKACFSHTFDTDNGTERELFDIIGDTKSQTEEFWMTSFGALIDEKP